MIDNRWLLVVSLASLALGPAALGAEGAERHDVPPGILESDADWQRFRLGPNDPLRSFEDDSEGWRLESWKGVPGLGEPLEIPAVCVPGQAAHGEKALAIPLELPRATVVFKRAVIGEYRYITYDVFLPEDAPGRLRSLFFVKDKDGHWFQALSARPYHKTNGTYEPGISPFRLTPGKWNTVCVDLRELRAALQPQGHMARWQDRFAQDTEYLGFAIFGDQEYKGRALLDNLRGWSLSDATSPLAIRNLSFPSRGIDTYDLFEVSFDLNREISDPFDPELITVAGVFQSPSGAETRIPGFFFQDYVRKLTIGGEEMLPCGDACWRIRYAPREAGMHRFRIEVTRGEEELVTNSRSFEARKSDHPGYIRVSEKDRRCLEFESGRQFYPIGHNFRSPNDPRCSFVLGWPLSPDEGTFTYDRVLEQMAEGGENFVEIWFASWWIALEWTGDWKNYRGLGRYNLANAWRLDHILKKCRDLDMRVQLVIDNHGKYSGFCDEEWRYSPYNIMNRSHNTAKNSFGYGLRRPEEFFSEERAKRLYKQRVRYLFSRWGWDPTIMGFEVVSELDLTGSRGGFVGRKRDQEGENAPLRVEHNWHKEMIAYFGEVDSGDHLYTTHYSGDYNNVDPVMARLEEIDYVVGDGYRGDSNPFDRLAHASAVNHEKFGKPFIITEYGGGWNGTSDPALEADLHSGLWGTYMTSAAGSPLLWWFDFIEQRNLYWHFAALRAFDRGEDRRDPALVMRDPAIENRPKDVELAARSFMSDQRGYAWVYAVEAMSRYPKQPMLIDEVSLRFDSVANGAWKIELWDTTKGEIVMSALFEATGGQLRIPLPQFANDIALKLRRVELLPDADGMLKESTKSWLTAVAESRAQQLEPAAGNSAIGFESKEGDVARHKFVRGWVLLGPYMYEQSKWDKAPETEFTKDERNLLPTNGAEVDGKRWQQYKFDGALSDHVNLDSFYGGKDSCVAYAAAAITCDTEMRDLVFLAGSDDTIRVYLNGESIHSLAAARGASPDTDRVEGVTLRKGRNVLLVKCGDIGGGWGFYARFTDREGRPLLIKPDAE